MKNIQVFDGATNAVFDIFQATEEEFVRIFPNGEDIAFIDEVYERDDEEELIVIFQKIWGRRIPKVEAMGIHGLLFYQMEYKKPYYPTRKDEDAINPGGSRLR